MATDSRDLAARAERLLEQALDEVRGGVDAIPTLSEAIAVLRVEAGELPADELGDVAVCICSPEQLARGAYRGGCPIHAAGRAA